MTQGAGWLVARSIALELDVALSMTCADDRRLAMPAGLDTRIDALPQAWHRQLDEFVADFAATGPPLLSHLAVLAGTFVGDDFAECTLPMRELDQAGALARLQAYDAHVDGSVSLPARLSQMRRDLQYAHGLSPPSSPQAERAAFELLGRILRDGDQHARFWQWLDEFYWRAYAPWRQTRLDVMTAQAERARGALGADAAVAGSASTRWLGPQHPVRHLRQLADEVSAGRLQVVFWVEPLGMADLWTLLPGDGARPDRWVVSFSPPGRVFDEVRERAADLAQRLDALSDPTRLLVLRAIRQLDADNTTIADMLDVARPTVSIHAKQLREAGLITSQRQGRSVKHRLCAEALGDAVDELFSFLALPKK